MVLPCVKETVNEAQLVSDETDQSSGLVALFAEQEGPSGFFVQEGFSVLDLKLWRNTFDVSRYSDGISSPSGIYCGSS